MFIQGFEGTWGSMTLGQKRLWFTEHLWHACRTVLQDPTPPTPVVPGGAELLGPNSRVRPAEGCLQRRVSRGLIDA